MRDWLLTHVERANSATQLDDHGDPNSTRSDPNSAWTDGNLVRPLIHGSVYFGELASAIERTRDGDTIMFVDWRGDPDEQLTAEPGDSVSNRLCAAAQRGVGVFGLIWRSHLDRFRFSERENRHLGEKINAAGGCCLLDMRVRVGGSHHQKFILVRYAARPELDVAFLGGIDLCHGRRDDIEHNGDPQAQPMAAVYGARSPWHDIQLAIQGPATADVETVFRERWEDPHPLSRNPLHRLADRIRRDDDLKRPLPARPATPARVGPHAVQLLRTYPNRWSGYPFAPQGERSIARGYAKALRQARQLIYIEDQYLWSREVAIHIAETLRTNEQLRLIAVLPHYPDQDGRVSLPPNLVGRAMALRLIQDAAPGRVGVYGIENRAGVPIYVHAKVCIIDDVWATTGSDNFNRRSWTHDSELTAVVWDHTFADQGGDWNHFATLDRPRAYPRDLRVTLAREHLGLSEAHGADLPDDVDLADPHVAFDAFAESAERLQRWTVGDHRTSRPPGQLRPLWQPNLSARTRAWATPLYRVIYDPDGRRRTDRRRGQY